MNQNQPKPEMTLQFICQSLKIPPIQIQGVQGFSAITTDSRKISPGCLFVAIPGEKFDGHDFISTAIQNGARGILCKSGSLSEALRAQGAGRVAFFEVADTIAGYRELARQWRKGFSITVIAVAGSVGKTSTKEILASILRGKWSNVLQTQASQNGFVGIPMTLLDLRSEHQAAVIEIGIDEIGAMQSHLEIVNPNATIVTAVGPEHLEKLIDVPTVAREENLALFSVAEKEGFVAVNLDDPWIRPSWEKIKTQKKIGFTLKTEISPKSAISDLIHGQWIISQSGETLTYWGNHGNIRLSKTEVPLPLQGKHNARNLLGAIALASILGLTSDEIRKGLQTFKGAEGRSQVRDLPGDIRVLCDYYNANPTSTVAGLELLAQLPPQANHTRTRRWACLADMLELGENEIQFHKELYKTILDTKPDQVLLLGPRMASLADELRQQKYPHCQHFSDRKTLAQALLEGIQKGDLVLIKGSRSMKMEEVWKQVDSEIRSRWGHS